MWLTSSAMYGSARFPHGTGEGHDTGPDLIKSKAKTRVLVVDDEGLIADSVAEILSENGYEATAAYSGESALHLAEEFCPDLLVTDVLMPRVNGVELAIRMKTLCPETKVLLFSGQAATSDLMRSAREQGIRFEILPKPIHPRDLLRKLETLSATPC